MHSGYACLYVVEHVCGRCAYMLGNRHVMWWVCICVWCLCLIGVHVYM